MGTYVPIYVVLALLHVELVGEEPVFLASGKAKQPGLQNGIVFPIVASTSQG